jgi:uncharacterized protein YkwD
MVLRRISTLALVLALTIVAAPTSGARTTGPQRLAGVEQGVVREINRVRNAKGLRPLAVVPGLQTAAVNHSRSMLQGGFFEHESPGGRPFWERIKRTYPPRGSDQWLVGENLFAKSAELSPQETVAAWLESPPHREILLSSQFRDVGIAVMRAPLAGGAFGNQATWVVTADFGTRSAR